MKVVQEQENLALVREMREKRGRGRRRGRRRKKQTRK